MNAVSIITGPILFKTAPVLFGFRAVSSVSASVLHKTAPILFVFAPVLIVLEQKEEDGFAAKKFLPDSQ